ncbi:MAG: hypothetical protein HYX34_06230 [Actinobacteria bacterium]|nr:hypothetical protein [Actinomycetota bacterium]
MTSRPRRSPRGSFRSLYRLFLRAQISAGRLVVVGAVSAVLLLMALAVRSRASHSIDPVRDAVGVLNGLGLSLAVPFLALAFASSVLGDLVDDRTLVYVWLRPVPRRTIGAAAALASATVVVPVTVIPLVVAAVVASGEPAVIGGTAVASFVGVIGYCGVFTWLGLRVRRALVWGVAYILLWEGFIVRASATAAKLAVRAYTRSILSEYTGVGLDQGTMPVAAGIGVPLAVAVVAVALTARRLQRASVD